MRKDQYDLLMEQFNYMIQRHMEEEMVGQTFTITAGGRVYSLTIDNWDIQVHVTANVIEEKSLYWVHDTESPSD